MPGLSQLKQFNLDILAVGKEAENRIARGEKYYPTPIPKNISDKDDSEDFVLGMPEISEEEMQANEQPIDDDFSDITGTGSSASDNSQSEETASVQTNVPDFSNLLNPIATSAEQTGGQMPDLSQFADEIVEETTEEIVEEEEPEIADMNLDDLLGSGSFEEEEIQELPQPQDEKIEAKVTEKKENIILPTQTKQPEIHSSNKDFDFSENEIDMGQEAFDDMFEKPLDNSQSILTYVAPKKAKTESDAEITDDTNSDLSYSNDSIENISDSTSSNDFPSFDYTENLDNPFTGKPIEDFESSDDDFSAPDFSSVKSSEVENSDFDTSSRYSVSDEEEDFEDNQEESAPIEKFDTSEMEGLDFTVTQEQKDSEPETLEFEIPGFSDTEEAKTDRSGRIKLPPKASKKLEEDEVPTKNSLTNEQYKKFLSNLATYPLNVRIAVENLLVANEFTDDAQFEIVQKILNKAPARQVASNLEKMLDISIPVPRDFERRTAEEYDAYKSSLQYQLKNKIIPGSILGVLAAVLIFGLFIFSRNFVYRPLMANNLYKQGYALLEEDEFSQSEELFIQATKYEYQKKWFFKYAQGYRLKKQYQRAEKFYKYILYYFNHDKQAGLEYAQMECYDIANYEKAESIVRRNVLDYHANDADGILLLGDIYLEWATEKDSTKFEEARKQYETLIELYGDTDFNLARMMKYYIRVDNLQEVLSLKEIFYPKAKTLTSDDWSELGGYLFDKSYGNLSLDEEYLRKYIQDVRAILEKGVRQDPSNPNALYNLSRYFARMKNDNKLTVDTLEKTLKAFKDKYPDLRRSEVYKYIETYRLFGGQYVYQKEYIKAQETYTEGINLFEKERELTGFVGNEQVGNLYADLGDVYYFIRGDFDSAYDSYSSAIDTKYNPPSIYYRVGYIQYNKEEYGLAVEQFIKALEEMPNNNNLLYAMGNALYKNNDYYAAEGYYNKLMQNLEVARVQKTILFPQENVDDGKLVSLYEWCSNNLGVTLFNIAKMTGDSVRNANAIVNFSTSLRAHDALTRNQKTMVREAGNGKNLAESNIKYMTKPIPEYIPEIYPYIMQVLSNEKGIQ